MRHIGIKLISRGVAIVATMEESPPSFCNGLGTIYIVSFRGRTIGLTTKDFGFVV